MSFDDYLKFFATCMINSIDDNHELTSAPASHEMNGHVFMTCDLDAGRHTFSASQIDKRMFPNNSGYSYSPCHLMLVKFKGSSLDYGFEYIQGNKGIKQRDALIEADLSAGKYGFFVEMDWEEETESKNPNHEFQVTRYGPDGEDEFDDCTQDWTKHEVLSKIMYACCDGMKLEKEFDDASNIKFYQDKNDAGYDFTVVVNNEEEASIQVVREFIDGHGYTFQWPNLGETKFTLDVGPRETKVGIIKIHVMSFSTSIRAYETVKMGDNQLI